MYNKEVFDSDYRNKVKHKIKSYYKKYIKDFLRYSNMKMMKKIAISLFVVFPEIWRRVVFKLYFS